MAVSELGEISFALEDMELVLELLEAPMETIIDSVEELTLRHNDDPTALSMERVKHEARKIELSRGIIRLIVSEVERQIKTCSKITHELHSASKEETQNV